MKIRTEKQKTKKVIKNNGVLHELKNGMCNRIFLQIRNSVYRRKTRNTEYISNRKGPSIDPCDTPAIIYFHRLKLLFTPVLCKRRLLEIYLMEVVDNP